MWSTTSAECSRAFVGMHPRCRQVPPTLSRSMSATLRPSCAARRAQAYPALPPPRIATSTMSPMTPSLGASPQMGSPPPRRQEQTIPLELDLGVRGRGAGRRSEEHTSELHSQCHLVCRLLLENKK